MKKGRKWAVIFLSLMLASVTLLAGCGGSKTDYSTLQQDVVKGSNVYVDESGVVFFGYNNLLCTALFEDGNVYDYVVEAGFTGDVYALAAYDNALYVTASDGIFKYDLEMFSGSEAASPTVLWEKYLSRYSPFQIYDGKMFFLYGTTLCYIPLDGGAETNLAMEAGDFEVTSNGIYYSKKDGSLHLVSIDGSEDKAVGQVAPAAGLMLDSGHIYYKDNYKIYDYSLDSGESAEVETASMTSEYCYPWAKDGSILYNGADSHIHLYKDDTDTAGDILVEYPFKYSGVIFKDWIVSQDADYKELVTVDFRTGAFNKYDLTTELADDLSKIGGNSGSAGQSSGNSGSGGSLAGYNIMDGFMKNASADGSIAYMYFNDFLLTMPNNDKWSMEEGKDYVTIYLWAAQQEGYGGKLVTIRAYDLNDNSYEQLPSYHVAGVGRNAGVRFIAEYPTDVQWNHDDAAQEADYRDLQSYLEKIGEGAVNSPLQTADSD